MARVSAAKERQKDATRLRIVEAAVELHSTVGPARTTISAVAERAGVPRLTVYRHFPDQRELERACSALATDRSPPPDPAGWDTLEPSARLRHGLDRLYAYYASNEGLVGNVLRDAEVLDSTREMVDLRLTPGLRRVRDALLKAVSPDGDRSRELVAAVELAAAFETWRLLVRRRRLSRRAAVDLMAAFVTHAAAGSAN